MRSDEMEQLSGAANRHGTFVRFPGLKRSWESSKALRNKDTYARDHPLHPRSRQTEKRLPEGPAVGLDRYENSAEHSWQLGLFATSLAPYAEPNTDINHVIRMLLVHDIGEIDTGDTFVFVQGGWTERKAAELIAVKRIFRLLPQNQAAAFLELWEEFELSQTPEARFANSVDRAMPVLLNLANNGGSWLETASAMKES
jgi:hypothetical protein